MSSEYLFCSLIPSPRFLKKYALIIHINNIYQYTLIIKPVLFQDHSQIIAWWSLFGGNYSSFSFLLWLCSAKSFTKVCHLICFPGGKDVKESACNAGDLGLAPRSGRSPGKRHGYPLQYSCLESSIDKGA